MAESALRQVKKRRESYCAQWARQSGERVRRTTEQTELDKTGSRTREQSALWQVAIVRRRS